MDELFDAVLEPQPLKLDCYQLVSAHNCWTLDPSTRFLVIIDLFLHTHVFDPVGAKWATACLL
uniref:Uncharacterized protein n=1 Tax=Ciona intestinalis TaxID=7719 RepID=H2XZ59_CIOIN